MSRQSDNERIKEESRLLRGTIAEGLGEQVTGALAPADTNILKFHGSYQQDDRDLRDERRQQKLEPAYMFMIRTRLPGGICKPGQWLALDDIAQRYGNGTLRLTTRQAFQLHGVIKRDLKPTMQAIHATMLDSIAACGDVNRNVMCNPNPVDSRAHEAVYQWAVRVSEHLLPKTRAYSELWLDGQKVEGPEEEPIYGPTYLPRKFKIGFAVPPLNDVDVYSQDLGFVAILEDGNLVGFNVLVGGGMGTTHGDPKTFPRVGDVIGFVRPERLLRVAEHVVRIQRDYGDRTDRKHARLKYTIHDRGIDWFVKKLHARMEFELEPARPFQFDHNGDRLGWQQGRDGRWNLTLFIESGRVEDKEGQKHLTGLREIAKVHRGDFRLTPNQNLIIAGIPAEAFTSMSELIVTHGLDTYTRYSKVRRNALACVALPTCGLAFAEAERYMPQFVKLLEERLAAHGLSETYIHVRMTGCPNGCARPFLAEVGLVGKGPGRYNVFLGGDRKGERLNRLYRENLDEAAIMALLDPILAGYARDRKPDEPFGDYLVRTVLAA